MSSYASNFSNFDKNTGLMADGDFTPVVSKATKKHKEHLARAASSLQVGSIPALSEGIVNVKKLNKKQVKDLQTGPTVAVYVEKYCLHTAVPKRALMAVSPKAHDLLKGDPLIKEIEINGKNADFYWMTQLLDQIATGIGHFKVVPDRSFIENIKIYQACYAVDINDFALSPLYKWFTQTIGNRLMTYEEIDAVVARISTKNRLFAYVANNLSYLRHKGAIPDSKDFAKYLDLEANKHLKAAMAAVDKKKHEQYLGAKKLA
ncbi:hypothetical protein BDV95DRAFT_665153 [Massariosphaeria phaeospora]|uniref:BTB domain-containing protein n=1 Tax=Massariosphaeria phaeospora TaxID=100035 RepID=A0A7C8IJB9_9PLEO|nr:hypothetical protein BDV95DRAFT_665153 [Massariosphaeria phaeospora]